MDSFLIIFVASLTLVVLGNIARGVNRIARIDDGLAIYLAISCGYFLLFSTSITIVVVSILLLFE